MKSRWHGQCTAGTPSPARLRGICRCKACYFYETPRFTPYRAAVTSNTFAGPLNNFLGPYCRNFGKHSSSPPSTNELSDDIGSELGASTSLTCEAVCEESVDAIVKAGMCWYHPVPPSNAGAKRWNPLCQFPSMDQNKYCLQARNAICKHPKTDMLTARSWYGPANKLSANIYMTEFERRRHKQKVANNKGKSTSGIYQENKKILDQACVEACK